MSKHLVVLLILFVIALSAAAQTIDINPALSAGEGDWVLADNRLVQKDVDAGMTKFLIPVPQTGNFTYDFNIKYEDGVLEDGHGGVGIHIFGDSNYKGHAWGQGASYLLWLNYDENPRGITKGLSAQVYRSINNSRMELLGDYDLNWIIDRLAAEGYSVQQVLSQPIEVKISANGNNGEVKIYSPMDQSQVYSFTLPLDHPVLGKYVALRTNGMSVSFGM